MVMAAARTLARRRMGACETTPPATYREHAHDPGKPTAEESFPAFEDLPPLAGVKLVRPRRCAAAGAPAGPWPRGERTRAAARKDPEEQSAQPGGAPSHRVRSVRPLDTGGPYGCRGSGLPVLAWCSVG